MEKNTKDFTNEDWNSFPEWIKNSLKENVVTVTFTKKDGNERIMHCTLDPAKLPPAQIVTEENKTPRKVSENTMAVYDIDNQGWRSFRWDSVRKIEFTMGD